MAGSADAWERLAEHLQLAERLCRGEVVEVEATEVKRVSGWEPRLLMKLDSRSQRPPVLAQHQATVWPIRNGRYAILPGDGYHDLESPPECHSFSLPPAMRQLETLPWDTVPSSESQMLDMALASGMLARFVGEERLALTIRGRLRAPAFEFRCRLRNGESAWLGSEGVQVEVDAGLEGAGIYLVEAKLGQRSDFHLRQLYYPFRMWSLRARKPVTTLFCCYHDRQFFFWQYHFSVAEDYHSLRLQNCAVYTLDPEVAMPDWREGVEAVLDLPLLRAPVPFPQADNLPRLIDLLDALSQGMWDRQALAARYDFVGRQADYYLNAARFLGWVEPNSTELTAEGAEFVRSRRNSRRLLLWQRLARLPVFRTAFRFMLAQQAYPDCERLCQWIEAETGLAGSTPRRRAATVLSWLRWVAGSLPGRQLSLF